jgi:SanA protein
MGLVYDDIGEVPPRDVALVLGTSKRIRGGQPNHYFHSRMEAAARLYHEGKVRHVLVSGSNPSHSYNEANDMLNALVALGVPRDAITRDYAGFRTLDSMIRCKEVFGQDSVIVVSQVAHNRRAIYLARSCGLDAVGYNAEDIRYWGLSRQRVRESLARCKALLDVHMLGKGPKFLGDPVAIPLDMPESD